MPIRASSSVEIRSLVDALLGDEEIQREAAIARLGIIGARAVDRLTDVYDHTTDRSARVAILRALEASADHRSAPLARLAMAEGGDVAVAAAGVLRALLTAPHAATAAVALDALIAAALDRRHDRRLRLAALDALQEMPADVRARVAAALHDDPTSGLRDVAGVTTLEGEAGRAEAVWRDAVEGRLPETPDVLRDALATRAGSAPLNTLRGLVDAVGAREREVDDRVRNKWLELRGALHQALALRGSRVALYDLRETVEEGRARLPASFLAALHVVGDVSCLEPLAARWAAAESDKTDDGARWRYQLAAALKAIAQREKITKRHAVMKRIAARWPGIVRL